MNLFDVLFAKKLSGGGSPFPPVIKRVTGNPIEFEDGADAPLVKCTTAITGSQDLHGQDKPWVGGAGKNKCVNASDTYSVNYATYHDYEIDNFESYAGQTITISVVTPNIQGKKIAIYAYGGGTAYGNGDYGETSATITIPANATGNGVRLYLQDYTSTEVQIKGFQFEAGSQATSFTPYSNICPITAYNQSTISVGGRNLWDSSLCTFSYMTLDGTIYKNTNTDTAAQFDPYISIYNESTLWFNSKTFTKTDNVYSMAINLRYDFSLIVIRHNGSNRDLVIRLPYLTKGKYVISFKVLSSNIQTVGGLQITNIQLERGEEFHDYEPYIAPTTHTATFSSAIYRGSEDCVNGEVTSEMSVIDLGDLAWSAYTTDTTGHSFYVNVPTGTKTVSSDSSVANLVCEIYETVAFINPSEWLRRNAIICQVPNAQRWIVRDERYSDATSFASAMSGVKLAYELATPTTSSVTPTNLPIKSLFGYNHIESSTGEMVVDYITDAYQNFVDTTERAIPSTRKGGVKAFDIFKTLDEPKAPEAPAEEGKPEEKETEEGAKK